MLLLLFYIHLQNQTVNYHLPRHGKIISSQLIYYQVKATSLKVKSIKSLTQRESLKIKETPAGALKRQDTAKKKQVASLQKINLQQEDKQVNKKELNKLILALFKAIQTHQYYPEMAKSLGQQGKVLVSFVLYRNGHIGSIQLVQSSGITSLDTAALKAVRDSSPLLGIKEMLQQQQSFTIPIVFRLA